MTKYSFATLFYTDGKLSWITIIELSVLDITFLVFWSVQPIPVHRYQPIGRTNLYGNLSPRRCCVDESVAWKFNIIHIYIFSKLSWITIIELSVLDITFLVFWSVQPIPVHRYQPIGRTNLYGNLSPRRCCVDESVAWKFNIIYIYIYLAKPKSGAFLIYFPAPPYNKKCNKTLQH